MHPPHSRLLSWWTDDPADPGRLTLDDPDVQALIAAISPHSSATDLGGVMSLNVGLDAAGLVLRVHQHFVSRHRLLALQALRQALGRQGLLVPMPVCWQGAAVFRCRNRWAELESHIPHQQPARTLAGYAWLFRATGPLHIALRGLALPVPRPLVATYAPPGSLRRWLPAAEQAVQADAEAREAAQLLHALISQLAQQWTPAARLPAQLVHGDISPRNVCHASDDRPVYLDFGFSARRPRVHELGYALAFMLYALGAHLAPDRFAWRSIRPLIETYEAAACSRLTALERRALAPYTASVPLYAAALDGFTESPVENIKARRPFLQLAAWLLAHPEALLGEAG